MKYLVLTLLALGAAVSSPAIAQQKPLRPLSETVLSFEKRGYVVTSAEDDGRTHEIEAIAPDNRRIEAVIEAATGEVLEERPDN
ncbi:PepSY domain-containing protein [Paracoccus onubensis]|uniref:PepSY domain-containing protein n=1 Tax=Paracoccus onubensis TaxID=1675788 RepID=UPI00272F9DCE|nr:PepSY domain-containing protein [Paracoccus onubensis]MDP0927745.1 PepSY domain-containing protein [Paracoccus onubensis]